MPSPTDRQRLLSELELLERVAIVGGTRELTALAFRIDEWLSFADAIALPDGTRFAEPGHALSMAPDEPCWLLPGARVLRVQHAGGHATATVADLPDAGLDPVALAAALRPIVVTRYLEGLPLATLAGASVPVVVADLLAAAQQAPPLGRATILDMLAAAMHDEAGWNLASARLKAGFEHGLGDRADAVRAAATRALVRLAAGLGPVAPGNPLRSLEVLFAVPRADVHAAALAAVADLPPDALERVRSTLAPLLRAAMVSAHAGERRLAAEVALRLEGGAADQGLSSDLDAGGERRLRALGELARDPAARHDGLLPKVLDAAHDADPAVRQAALAVLHHQIEREAAPARRRILATLLTSPDARLVQAGLSFIATHLDQPSGGFDGPDLRADADLKTHVHNALDGPEDSRGAAARLWIAWHRDQAAEVAAEAYALLLRHADPVVRQAALRDLAVPPGGVPRAQVRDLLHKPLIERLRDPEPALRVEAMRAVVGQQVPRATGIVAQLALDPEPLARHGVVQVLRETGAGADLAAAEATSRHTEALLAPPSFEDAAGQHRWRAALAAVCRLPSPWVADLLVAALADAPERPTDQFWAQAVASLDDELVRRADDPDDLLPLCHRLLEPPLPRPVHATRLAGRIAASSPRAVDFLWAIQRQVGGAAAAAARVALAGIGGVVKSPAVEEELHVLALQADDPADREFLRQVGRQPPGAPRR